VNLGVGVFKQRRQKLSERSISPCGELCVLLQAALDTYNPGESPRLRPSCSWSSSTTASSPSSGQEMAPLITLPPLPIPSLLLSPVSFQPLSSLASLLLQLCSPVPKQAPTSADKCQAPLLIL